MDKYQISQESHIVKERPMQTDKKKIQVMQKTEQTFKNTTFMYQEQDTINRNNQRQKKSPLNLNP